MKISKTDKKKALKDLLEKEEEWLLGQILGYAIKQGYSAHTSTLKEAWRLSISGLSASIIEALQLLEGQPPEMTPEEDFSADPVAQFGILEARRHRERGISLEMFLGLMKYYRQSYVDLIEQSELAADVQEKSQLFTNRVFDRIEIGFCMEWSGARGNKGLHELQISNRQMTNEKNRYLTIFESIPHPVILLNREKKIDNMNFAAASLFKQNLAPGSHYYSPVREQPPEAAPSADHAKAVNDPAGVGGVNLLQPLRWLQDDLEQFYTDVIDTRVFEKRSDHLSHEVIFRVTFAKNLDVSGKFEGTIIILEDITSLKKALEEVKTLSGLLPICSYCKNIRDGQGCWHKVEKYVQDRSEAAFSHGICPDCAQKYFPNLDVNED